MSKEEEIEELIKELNCDDVIMCQKARRALVAMGHIAVPALTEALGSKNHWVRWESAKALSQIGDPTAAEALVKALTDKEFDVRWLAAEGLIAIGQKAIVPLLRSIIDNPESIWLREGTHHVLHDMHKNDWSEVLRPVMVALEDVEPSVAMPWAAKKALDILLAKQDSRFSHGLPDLSQTSENR